VKTFTVHPGTMRTAALSPLPSDNRKLTQAPATANPASVTTVNTVKSEAPVQALPPAQALPPPPGAKPGVLGVLPGKFASAGDSVPVPATMVETAAKEPVAKEPAAREVKPRGGGWMIQVGAFPEEKEAQQRLSVAQSKAKEQLGHADPFTERTAKGDKALFRARFAGLDKDQAENACKNLKRSEIPCMLLKN